jgi:hypothetical protein
MQPFTLHEFAALCGVDTMNYRYGRHMLLPLFFELVLNSGASGVGVGIGVTSSFAVRLMNLLR